MPRLAARLTEGGARLPVGPEAWGETWVRLPPGAADSYTDRFSGRRLEAPLHEGRRTLRLADVLAVFPVALLVSPPAATDPAV